MLVYFPLVHYICNRLFSVVLFVAKLLFQHPFLSVLQSDTRLLLTQMCVTITVRFLEHMEMCFNQYLRHLQASILRKIKYSCMSKATGCFMFMLIFFVRNPRCVLFSG